ncbi:MAG: dihydropteroate synthase [Deltaproteobacteria bacterium]|nr:MAG: dihydropteroate synthase [Deltaproteobacteria bacterium]
MDTTFSIRWFHVPDLKRHPNQATEEFVSSDANWAGNWVKVAGLTTPQCAQYAESFSQKTGGEFQVLPHPTTLSPTLFLEYSPRRLEAWCQEGKEPLHSTLSEWLGIFTTPPLPWKTKRGTLSFSEGKPLVMGIVNVTPDSFSDGGHFYQAENAIAHGCRMAEQGADVLDIGGESTRPGSASVTVEDELARVIPVIEGLREQTDVTLSIDTTKAAVAEAALQAGADIVNDVSNMRFDPELPNVIARHQAHVFVMHSRHTPATMQKAPHYDVLWDEIVSELDEGLQLLLDAGVPKHKIGIDPGIGFGKRLEDNYRILRELPSLYGQGYPVLVGASRKSFLGAIVDQPAHQRLEGSLAAACVSSWHGAHMLRVHDVEETVRLLKVMQAIQAPPQKQ